MINNKIKLIKIIIGVILLLFGLFIFVSASEPCRTPIYGNICPFFNLGGLTDFGITLNGLVLVFLFATFIVWLFGGLEK